MSLSASALAALHKLGGYTLGACSGSDYWMYEGKTLDEIRVAKESENEGDWLTELEADPKMAGVDAVNLIGTTMQRVEDILKADSSLTHVAVGKISQTLGSSNLTVEL